MKMDVGVLEQTLETIAREVANIVDTLVPLGLTLAGSFTVLSVVMLGISVVYGLTNILPQVVRATGVAAATFWVIQEWPDIVMGTRDAGRGVIGLMIPGYHGPTTLFEMALQVSGRLEHEVVSISWATWWQGVIAGVVAAFIPPLILLGLSFIGLMALLAELILMLGGAVGPLVLPALAFSVSAPLGWGAIQFLVTAGVRVVVSGAMAHLFAVAITGIISVYGTENQLQHEEVGVLALLSLFSVMAALSVNTIAGSLVGNALGALGVGSVMRTTATLSTAASMGAAAVTGGAATAGAIGRAGSAAAGRASAGAAAKIGQSSGQGSAFVHQPAETTRA